MDDRTEPADCPRCDALREQLAELRGELLSQSRQVQQILSQLLSKISEVASSSQAQLLEIVKEDRDLIREVVAILGNVKNG